MVFLHFLIVYYFTFQVISGIVLNRKYYRVIKKCTSPEGLCGIKSLLHTMWFLFPWEWAHISEEGFNSTYLLNNNNIFISIYLYFILRGSPLIPSDSESLFNKTLSFYSSNKCCIQETDGVLVLWSIFYCYSRQYPQII